MMETHKSSDVLIFLSKIMLIVVIAFIFMMLSMVVIQNSGVSFSPPESYIVEAEKFSLNEDKCVIETWCLDHNTVQVNGQDCKISTHECTNNEQCYRGACAPVSEICRDECSYYAEAGCFEQGYRVCGEFDSDPCLEWSEDVSCLSGEICSDGKCISG